jgi:hypothetical protein
MTCGEERQEERPSAEVKEALMRGVRESLVFTLLQMREHLEHAPHGETEECGPEQVVAIRGHGRWCQGDFRFGKVGGEGVALVTIDERDRTEWVPANSIAAGRVEEPEEPLSTKGGSRPRRM